MNDDIIAVVGLVIGLIVGGLLVGILLGGSAVNNKWKKDSIKQGYAEFNQITAKWQWKDLKDLKEITK